MIVHQRNNHLERLKDNITLNLKLTVCFAPLKSKTATLFDRTANEKKTHKHNTIRNNKQFLTKLLVTLKNKQQLKTEH